MLPETYRMVAEREEYYWWRRARRAMSAGLLLRYGLTNGARWLDLGCGPGGNFILSRMLKADLIVGLDVSSLAHDEARRKFPDAFLVRADLNNALPFADGEFDVVTIFNVLYHDWIKSEATVVAEIWRVLRPGGLVLITEPAFSILSREMDVASMGHRRYRTDDIAAWCRAARLEVKFASYFTSFGFPLLLGLKIFRWMWPSESKTKVGTAPDMKPLNPILNGILQFIAEFEASLLVRGLRVPFGTTVACVAKRPGKVASNNGDVKADFVAPSKCHKRFRENA